MFYWVQSCNAKEGVALLNRFFLYNKDTLKEYLLNYININVDDQYEIWISLDMVFIYLELKNAFEIANMSFPGYDAFSCQRMVQWLFYPYCWSTIGYLTDSNFTGNHACLESI